MGILINDFINSYDTIIMLGPCPCSISKIKESYRWQIMLKGEFDFKFAQELKDYIYKISAPIYTEVKVSIDINPNSLL